MIMRHNSLDAFFRSPFGALPCGGQARLRVTVSGEAPERIEMRAWNSREHRFPMRPLGVRDGAYVYEAEITVPQEAGPFWYRFEAVSEGQRTLLGAPEDGEGCGEGVMGSEDSFQVSVYSPFYETPEWVREGVLYQIMVDRFYHGEGTDDLLHARDGDDIVLHETWEELPSLRVMENQDNAATDFFGGNLEGIRQKLPYLRDLGVTVLYLNPIFKANSNHKYDTGDYTRIDPMFGDEQTFSRLCREAKAMGIRIILDGVFSHVGDDSVYFNRRGTYGSGGAYRDPNSPYASWFDFRNWPDDYACWWGFRTLPNVRETDEAYRKFILSGKDSVIRHWMRAGASGWRLDVADELPMSFLSELRSVVKEENPDAYVLGEVWEDASHKIAYGEMRSYVTGDTLDGVMNYPLREGLIDFLMSRKSAKATVRALSSLLSNYPAPFLYSLMNLLGSHDRPRILNVLAGCDGNDLPRSERAAVTLTQEERMMGTLREHLMLRFLLSMPGIPCIFYGDEAGLEGCADPYCRRTYPWGHEDAGMLSYYRKLIRLRRENPVLMTGDCRIFSPCEDVLAVRRAIEDGRDVFGKQQKDAVAITMINRAAKPVQVFLTKEDVQGRELLVSGTGAELLPTGGSFSVRLPSLRGITLLTREG
ncbi:MAG: glycoside hydrolase family 13 protein [Clostridiales bacterium]|nr:glycoside hydrolase family 13 protein [Clostridiales bacterium]